MHTAPGAGKVGAGMEQQGRKGMENQKLRDCPFCGGPADLFSKLDGETLVMFEVYCLACVGRGPQECDADRAMDHWNKRPWPVDAYEGLTAPEWADLYWAEVELRRRAENMPREGSAVAKAPGVKPKLLITCQGDYLD